MVITALLQVASRSELELRLEILIHELYKCTEHSLAFPRSNHHHRERMYSSPL